VSFPSTEARAGGWPSLISFSGTLASTSTALGVRRYQSGLAVTRFFLAHAHSTDVPETKFATTTLCPRKHERVAQGRAGVPSFCEDKDAYAD